MAPKRLLPLWMDLFDDGDGFAGSVIVSTCNWLARAAETYDQWDFTAAGTINIGDVHSVKRNGKTVSFTATAGTAANIATGLYTALSAQTNVASEPEFTEYTWTNPSSGVLRCVANTGGIPATFTTSVTGSGTNTAVHTTTATGPGNWDDANNWDTASVPGNGDTANVNLDLGSVLYGTAQSSVTLAVLNIFSSGTTQNQVGLPKINASGNYTEDRQRELYIGATDVKVECGSAFVNLRLVGTTAVEGRRTGRGQQEGTPALLIYGGDSSSTYEINNGSLGLGFFDGQTATGSYVRIGQSGECKGGGAATMATISNVGQLDHAGPSTTILQGGGQAILRGASPPTTLTGTGGNIDCRLSGTITTLSLRDCLLDKSNDLSALTITTTTLNPGGRIRDPQQTITYTNKPALGAGVKELSAA